MESTDSGDVTDLDRGSFNALQGAQNERVATVKKATEAFAKASCAIETLDRMIKAGMAAPPESTTPTLRYIKQFRADLAAAQKSYRDETEKSVLSDKYWNKTLFPGIDLSARTLELKGDTDLLLLYTMKQTLFPGIDLSARTLEIKGDTDLLLIYTMKQTLFPGVDLSARTLEIKGDTDLLLIYTMKQTLFPGVDLSARKLEIKGDTDLLLLYTMKQSLWAAAEALLAATRRATAEANIDNEIKALEKAVRGNTSR
ncbi:putative mitochondrial inner membrane protein mitofilin [Operophtera brumata]|uniref:Putative mitochondrial inner membrane protein mitofilin n=1 Tax=Operophtera brumata TaxID=104452 RepID=A0A0L7KTE0_OPEBR|nr:putative mitochondrial inner membrane protein mitofilin [Operophtera brumata]